MHSPGNSEPQPVVHRDELSSIPIKKRRFLIVSPPWPEEKIPDSGNCESKNKHDEVIPSDVGSIRSNWDLNTTMEDWAGASSKSDSLVAHTFDDTRGFVKTSSCHDEKSSLPTAENVGLGLSKGKQHIPDVQKPNSSNATTLVSPQCKIDDSLVPRLEMPHRESLSLSGNFISSVNPKLGSQPVQMSATNMDRAVKLEPVDQSYRRDCSVGGSSSNMLSLKLGSVKTESLSNRSLETVLKSPVNPDKVVNQSRSMKPEVHQERRESSSFSLTVPLMPKNCIEHSNHNKDLQLGPCNTDYKDKLVCVDEEELLESDCGSRGNCAVGSSVGIRESIRCKGDEDLEEGEVREPVQLPVIEEGPSDVWNNSKNLECSGKEDSAKESHVKSDFNIESVGISLKSNSEDKQLNLSGRKNIEETSVKEISIDRKTNVDSGIGSFDLEDAATTNPNKAVQEICPVQNVSTLSNMVEASLSGQNAAKDSGNKRRIINLSRASVVVKSPGITRPVPNRFMVPRSGKERCSDLNGEVQPCGNRERNFSAGSNKFLKDRVNDQSTRNSRPNFMHGKGRKSGRFSSLHSNEWDSNHEFAPETSYGPSNYRRKRALDAEIECDGYDIPQDGNNNNRRKTTKNEFPQANISRLSPGDNSNRNGSANRGKNQNFQRFPRNMSPNDDMFTRHLSDDLMSHVYNHPEAMYDEPDLQLDWDNWNFSRKGGYARIRSKSPVSPRRRFPNGLQDLPHHRSPGFYQTRRMRSPEQRYFRDEIFPRRHGSPYGNRHLNNDLWISRNPDRRGSPGQVFPRNGRRTEVLDSREMGDGDEYMNNETFQSNKFHDERRNFDERRGPKPTRLFQPGYNRGDGENFRFHMNDGPSLYRFCPETDAEFVEIGDNIRERKFDGRIKHQPMGSSRRNRNVEELQDGNYRTEIERVWHDDGFGDDDGKKEGFEHELGRRETMMMFYGGNYNGWLQEG